MAAQAIRQRVGSVERDEQHAVAVSRSQVPLDAILVRPSLRHQEDELHPLGIERLADAAHHARKEGVTEELCGGLGDHDRNRVAASRDQAAGRVIWDVAQLLDGGLHGGSSGAADTPIAVDDPRGGRA